MSDVIKVPSPIDGGSTPRPKDHGEFNKIAKSFKLKKPKNFEKAFQCLKDTGQIKLEFFDSPEEVGQFIDWYNQMNIDIKSKWAENEINEISKYLAKTQGRTTIRL